MAKLIGGGIPEVTLEVTAAALTVEVTEVCSARSKVVVSLDVNENTSISVIIFNNHERKKTAKLL